MLLVLRWSSVSKVCPDVLTSRSIHQVLRCSGILTDRSLFQILRCSIISIACSGVLTSRSVFHILLCSGVWTAFSGVLTSRSILQVLRCSGVWTAVSGVLTSRSILQVLCCSGTWTSRSILLVFRSYAVGRKNMPKKQKWRERAPSSRKAPLTAYSSKSSWKQNRGQQSDQNPQTVQKKPLLILCQSVQRERERVCVYILRLLGICL